MPDSYAHRVAVAEALYLDARDLHDRHEISQARGVDEPGLGERVRVAAEAARAAVGELASEPQNEQDARAVLAMTEWLDDAVGRRPSGADPGPDAGTFEGLRRQIIGRYGAEQGAVRVGGTTLTRLATLGRLADEPSAEQRRLLFLALEPVWRSIAGDGAAASPYRRLLQLSARRWAAGHSPVQASALALGIEPAAIEPYLVQILRTWRDANSGREPVEPWDWWYEAGTAERALAGAIPLARLLPITRAYHAAVGADLDALGVGFDIMRRPGRPAVPVAYTTFGSRPREAAGEARWSHSRPWIFATYTGGGLGELTELIHETGHAIHVAAIRTRPAFADWPDSDAMTEALAELLALDTAEPAWQQHWLGASAPEPMSLRGRYCDVALDVCWALFEIWLHAAPDRDPDEVWAELTSGYLGIAAHPEWPWWAMRGQLIDAPGYMTNYAIGAILAADLRAAIRAARGAWTAGDPGWYSWVSERIYQWGLTRTSGDVLRSALGRPPLLDALLTEISRVG